MTDALLASARRIAVEVFEPAAEGVDRAASIPRTHFDALAGAGLYGAYLEPAATLRPVVEALAGACGSTTFTWTQHAMTIRLLAARHDERLSAYTSGTRRGGVAFAHLRRPGPPMISARTVADGIVLDGQAPWMTGWGHIDTVLVGARRGADVLWCLVPVDRFAAEDALPLDLSAMAATSTVTLAFRGVRVPNDDIVFGESFAAWCERDLIQSGQPLPAVLGLTANALGRLDAVDEAAAAPLSDELGATRARAYRLADERPHDLDTLLEARGAILDLVVRATSTLVAAVGGGAMRRDHPAQRLSREATFYLVQGQTPGVRAATIRRMHRAG